MSMYIYHLLQDLHEFFPHLLANVFGFDQGPGWQLRVFSAKLHSDFETVRSSLQ